MKPEREGRGPRQDKTGPALRFGKGADIETAGPKAKGRPAGAWKKTAARMGREQRPPEPGPVADPTTPENTPTEQEFSAADDAPERPADNSEPGTSGQSVPKYRQHSKREMREPGASDGKFRHDSKQARPAEKLHNEPGKSAAEMPGDRKSQRFKRRAERQSGRLGAAKERLARQKPVKNPGPLKQAAGFAGRSVHSFAHGKVYSVEQENVGVEGAHRAELAAEAAGRKTVRFTKQRIRSHPARAVKKAEGKSVKAAADYHFRQTVLEHPEMEKKNRLSRLRKKHRQRRQYQKRAKEAAKQGARAAEKTAVTTEKAVAKTIGFIRRHPIGAVIALLCVLLLMVMQSCTSSFAAIGNSLTGSVAATTYPAEDADLLGAEAAYVSLESGLQARLDNYRADHSYNEYHFDLDDIEHDPYVLLSILSALHPEGWVLADVGVDLQALFDRQYILTENVVTETRTRTVTNADGVEETEEYPYTICTVTLENFNLSHVPVYIMGEDRLSRYSMYMAVLGNRPDLFPDSPYVNRYGPGAGGSYEIPPEALTDETFAAMIREAEKYLGYPYVWGGASPATSFDCSGFVSWVINHCGCGWNYGRRGSDSLYFDVCTPIAPSEAKPGDLIFFQKTYDTDNTSHVGIYVGNGMMIHCGDPIQYTSINTSYWQEHFYGFGRLPRRS